MAADNLNTDASATSAAGAPGDGTPSGVKVDVNNRMVLTRRAGWWGILGIYAILFLSMGYMAFFSRDVNPALQQGLQTAATTDDETKAVLLSMIQQEANEHNKKQSLALQSFNVVLGSLLGFLSASAVSKVGGSDNN